VYLLFDEKKRGTQPQLGAVFPGWVWYLMRKPLTMKVAAWLYLCVVMLVFIFGTVG